MSISAPGIGSGLDIKGIVAQLVSLEKRPLAQLEKQSSSLQTKLSAFGQLRSQLANLQDQAGRLGASTLWEGLSFNSSNTAAVSGTIDTRTAQATRFSVQVSQLAQAQATASAPVTKDTPYGAGSLSIQLGQWNDTTFAPGEADAITVNIEEGDTLSTIATKINQANAGVSATVLRDASGERLIIRSAATGVNNGFRIQANGDASLDALRYDPEAGAGMDRTQQALNTQATINGVSVTSTDNRLENAVPGVTLNFQQVTSGPVEVRVSQDTNAIRNQINALVQSFNSLSSALREMTKYEPGTKTAGSLQGDSTAVNLQNALRRLITTPQGAPDAAFRNLSDVGLEFQLDGTLKVNETKLNSALNNPEGLRNFFAGNGGAVEGLAKRVKNFAEGMLAATGGVGSRQRALQTSLERNSREVERLNERIERTEARLLQQYSRLDAQLGSLSALSSYVEQQVNAWNNQRSNR